MDFQAARRQLGSPAILQPFDHCLQPRDVVGLQPAVFGEVGDQGGELAVEQSVEQALAFGLDIVGAGEQRPVAVAAILADRFDSLLLEQAIDQGLDRRLAPGLRRSHLGDDLVGVHGAAAPQRFHDLAFGGGDAEHIVFTPVNLFQFTRVRSGVNLWRWTPKTTNYGRNWRRPARPSAANSNSCNAPSVRAGEAGATPWPGGCLKSGFASFGTRLASWGVRREARATRSAEA